MTEADLDDPWPVQRQATGRVRQVGYRPITYGLMLTRSFAHSVLLLSSSPLAGA